MTQFITPPILHTYIVANNRDPYDQKLRIQN